MDQDETWYGGRHGLMSHCVRWEPSSHKGAQPKFSAHVRCGHAAGWMKMPLGTYRPGPRRHCFTWGPSSFSPKRRTQQLPNFWFMYCGQTAGWIKMPLFTQVDLGPGHIVLDGDPAPPSHRKEHISHLFSAHVYCGQTVVHPSYC